MYIVSKFVYTLTTMTVSTIKGILLLVTTQCGKMLPETQRNVVLPGTEGVKSSTGSGNLWATRLNCSASSFIITMCSQ